MLTVNQAIIIAIALKRVRKLFMKAIQFLLLIVTTILLWTQCVPVKEEVIADIDLNIKDKRLQNVFNLQDQGLSDSLYTYFSDIDPTYRYAAAMAFGSHRDTNAISRLAFLLKDPNQDVRVAAAYAIGQISNISGEQPLLNNFERGDSTGYWDRYNMAVLEAVGKCGSDQTLSFLSNIQSFTEKDTLLVFGQALGIYRFALRRKITNAGTQKMLSFISSENTPRETQYIAASYLGRVRDLNLQPTDIQNIIRKISNASDYRVRMNLVLALGKAKSPIAKDELLNLFNTETDFRVKVNIIRALKNYPYAEVQRIPFLAIHDSNPQLAKAAVNYLIDSGEGRDGTVYWRLANTAKSSIIKLGLLKAANKHVSALYEEANLNINYQIKQIFNDTTAAMDLRAAAIDALAEYNWNFRYIHRNGFNSKSEVLRTAAVNALGTILRDPNFDKNFGLGKTSSKREISVYLSDAINGTDPAMKAVAAEILADSTLAMKTFYPNSSFLHVAKRNLKLPQETETLYYINSAINTFDGGTPVENEIPEFNRPIDWTTLDKFEGDIKARIETKKGDIILDLFPLKAPGSVINFIKLSGEGFYDGKNFHRMVPNFVLQGGCPRGDGYGSLDYSIRSEIPNLYYNDGGYLGMASAGPHTEGVQWFITHSSTPHLDGRYTIFGKISNGMNVVQNLDVGDIIKTIKILN
mgnify:CR=1 FL=1